jgi:hypothetical protein
MRCIDEHTKTLLVIAAYFKGHLIYNKIIKGWPRGALFVLDTSLSQVEQKD